MDLPLQIVTAITLAACAGMRATVPLLAVSMMARAHCLPLNPAYAFLARDEALIVLAIAAALEVLGDKIVVIDHALDAVGTVLRPVAGAVLASSVVTKLDPTVATMLG